MLAEESNILWREGFTANFYHPYGRELLRLRECLHKVAKQSSHQVEDGEPFGLHPGSKRAEAFFREIIWHNRRPVQQGTQGVAYTANRITGRDERQPIIGLYVQTCGRAS